MTLVSCCGMAVNSLEALPAGFTYYPPALKCARVNYRIPTQVILPLGEVLELNSEEMCMQSLSSTHVQYFSGNIEQCLEQFGGRSRFNVSAPLTFFSGARLETHRRAQSKDGAIHIVERETSPAVCEVYVDRPGMRPQSVRPATVSRSSCA